MPYIPPQYLPGDPPSNPGNIHEGGVEVSVKPPFIAVPNCAKVELRWTGAVQNQENVFYMYKAGGFDLTACISLATACHVAWQAYIKPLWSTQEALVQIKVSDMSTRYGAYYEFNVDPYEYGTREGTPAPNNNTIGLGFHTGFRGKGQNGRLFAGGMLDEDFLNSLPVDDSRTLVLDAWVNFFTEIAGDGFFLVVASFKLNKLWRSTAQVTNVYYLTVGEYIYTMRRRLPGHNRHR